MTRRRLRPDELELWHQIAQTTDPLSNRPRPEPASKPAPTTLKQPRAPEPMLPFRLGQAVPVRTDTHVMPQTTSQRLRATPLQMDARAFTKLKRGKLKPESRIDLHGMTLDQAHPTLMRFILSAQSQGQRLVLVITGKGSREDPYDPAPRRRGVLKSQVPQWLRMAPLAQAVLQISEAHIRHGGAGAYYVYLRKPR